MKLVLTTLLALVLASILVAARSSRAGASADPTLADLAWIAGHWAGEEHGSKTEEAWFAPAGGLMLGMNREVRASGKAFFEYLRIEERENGLVYVASPLGRGATDFELLDLGAGFVEFENPRNDFPRRIRYERRGDSELVARVSGGDDAEEPPQTWTWKRVPAK